MSLVEETNAENGLREPESGKENQSDRGRDLNRGWRRLIGIFREMVTFIFSLCLTLLLTHSDLNPWVWPVETSLFEPSFSVTRAPRPPKPLFNGSNVDDFFSGKIYAAFDEAEEHDDAFFMFYAPWDTDSRLSVPIFERVAQLFAPSNIYFAAVNCWAPGSDCRKEFVHGNPEKVATDHIRRFPVFVFYPNNGKGIHYWGPITEQSLIEFLLSARRPFSYVATHSQFKRLRGRHNGKALVGYFPDITTSGKITRSFRHFYSSILHLLSLDPFRNIVGSVAVVTSPHLATHLHLDYSRPARYFYTNGSSVAFPNKTIISSTSFTDWVNNIVDDPIISWVGAAGWKSHTLAGYLRTGSSNSLLVFYPKLNRYAYQNARSTLSEIALRYVSCTRNDPSRLELIGEVGRLKRDAFHAMDELRTECTNDPWFVKTFSDEYKKYIDNDFNTTLSARQRQYILRKVFRNGPGKSHRDAQVSEAHMLHRRLSCAMMLSSVSLDVSLACSADVHADTEFNSDEGLDDLWSLGCQDNRTLNFYLVDRVSQWNLASKLGIESSYGVPQAAIIDLRNEIVYKMDPATPFSAMHLANFIQTFHSNQKSLTRLKKSKDVESTHHEHEGPSEELSVKEINSDIFDDWHKHSDIPAVLLYRSNTCAFCTVASHVFLTVKKLMSPMEGNINGVTEKLIEFAVIDASENDLPWTFTALSTPSILFFHKPNFGKLSNVSETRAFPSEKALNVQNLVSFVMANLSPESRLKLALSFCDADCVKEVQAEMAHKDKNSIDAIFMESSSHKKLLDELLEARLSEAMPGSRGKERLSPSPFASSIVKDDL